MRLATIATALCLALSAFSVSAQSITPSAYWIFGGVVCELNGVFPLNPTVRFGTTAAEVLSASATRIVVIAPPSPATGSAESFAVDVSVSGTGAPVTLDDAFTYRRRATREGARVTAFYFDPGATALREVEWLDQTRTQLTIPPAARGAQTALVAGLFRASANASMLRTNEINVGDAVSGAPLCALHFFEDTGAAPPAEAGALVWSAIEDWNYALAGEEHMTLEMPIGTGLTAGTARTGLTVWAARTLLDLPTMESVFFSLPTTRYQATVLANETSPALSNSSAAGTPLTRVRARLYETGAFALRRNALPTASVAAGIRVNSASGVISAPAAGGTTIPLQALIGGLGWVDRIELITSEGEIAATVTEGAFDPANGLSETALAFTLPAACVGILDLRIFLRANPATPFATLSRALELAGSGDPCVAPPGGCAGGTLAPTRLDGTPWLWAAVALGLLTLSAAHQRAARQRVPVKV